MIVVAGMHRSGTSLVAQLLDSLGISVGDKNAFYAADEWNPRGYFERNDVVDLNSRLITGHSRTGTSMQQALSKLLYLRMPSRARIERLAERYTSEIDAVGATCGGIAVKDPRFCVTASAWAQRVPIDAYVVGLRDPAEAVLSLWRRQRIPQWLGFRFWNYHVRCLLEQFPPDRTVYVHYNELVSGDRDAELQRVVDFFSLDLDAAVARERFATVFSDKLYRNRPQPRALPATTQSLWEEVLERRA
ncbi:MAG: sulfotransferase [Planctomycetota bacterium]